ncbi:MULTISPECIES: DMT family transporter [Halorussus]|uniref:DMT family transporter n=1 Tax=Halorussus TaxID=1070314 RepID=UPI000E215746|nr:MULTISPECIES: EamA family transporter [Halorussus]NHN61456.1 EamA family transporter [Halorussus sp. JP-T4]
MVEWSDVVGRAVPSVSPHTRAALEALFVTFLWSSSYVLIHVGLDDIPALTFAGLRYGLAAVVLVPSFVRRGHHRAVRRADRSEWALLVALGLLLYAVTQGAQFVALGHLRSATVSLVLTFTPVAVALAGVSVAAERPTGRQWVGLAALLGGAGLYFRPWAGPLGSGFGLAVMSVGLAGNAAGSLVGRRVNRDGPLSPVAVTTVSMGIGAGVLLAVGVAVQGLPALPIRAWGIVAWLAVVNTAGAFTLWNRTLRTLSAVESSAINNTMLVQVAVLGWLFLGEQIRVHEAGGILAVAAGALLVQLGSGDR